MQLTNNTEKSNVVHQMYEINQKITADWKFDFYRTMLRRARYCYGK